MSFIGQLITKIDQQGGNVNYQPKLFLRVFTVLTLLVSFNFTLLAQSKLPNSVKDYTSIARISGTADGKNITFFNPFTNQNQTSFAGTFNGTLNSEAKKFYCIDLGHSLATNQDYWDEGYTPSEITYILNNYFPYKRFGGIQK